MPFLIEEHKARISTNIVDLEVKVVSIIVNERTNFRQAVKLSA
jgi:hypothetical protein